MLLPSESPDLNPTHGKFWSDSDFGLFLSLPQILSEVALEKIKNNQTERVKSATHEAEQPVRQFSLTAFAKFNKLSQQGFYAL